MEMKRIIRQIILVLMDVLSVNLVMLTAVWMENLFSVTSIDWGNYQVIATVITAIIILCFKLFGLYDSLWRYASTYEFLKVVSACMTGSIATYIVTNFSHISYLPITYIGIGLGYILMITGIRLAYRVIRRCLRMYQQRLTAHLKEEQERVMIIGAGEAATLVIKECYKDPKNKRNIVVAIDDDSQKQGSKINGVPIKGTTACIEQFVKEYRISEIIIAMPSAHKKKIAEVIESCSRTNCKLKIFPGIDHSLRKNNIKQIRNVNIEDLLGREEIILNNNRLKFIVHQKTILVTGGGGSIGSEICRQIAKFPIKQVVIFEIYENSAYSLQVELKQLGIPSEKVKVEIGSIRDKIKLQEVFEKYKPELVFHAAAHKHVPLMENNPEEAVKNNVLGTLNVLQCVAAFKIEKFILISTDKAVNPTSVMGVTKRIGEMLVEAMDRVVETTEFVAVRFGNVLGSNGSVIPLFKMQLEKGGPITVTHPEIERYFMTIPEAVRLILEALTFAKGGEIFVLDMGQPVKILDLAKNFIRLSGFEEGEDVEIKFTGLRPGEKLYEELLMAEEGLGKTSSDKIFIGRPEAVEYNLLLQQIELLKQDMEEGRDIRARLREIVPSYQSMEEANKKVINS